MVGSQGVKVRLGVKGLKLDWASHCVAPYSFTTNVLSNIFKLHGINKVT